MLISILLYILYYEQFPICLSQNNSEAFQVYRQCACYCCDELPSGFVKFGDNQIPMFDVLALKDHAKLFDGQVWNWRFGVMRYCMHPGCGAKHDLQFAS